MYLMITPTEGNCFTSRASSEIPFGEKLLVFRSFEGEPEPPYMSTVKDVFSMMDLSDCYPVRLDALYQILAPGKFRRLEFLDTWHDVHDPLRMEIIDAETLETVATWYGSDH